MGGNGKSRFLETNSCLMKGYQLQRPAYDGRQIEVCVHSES